MSQLIAMGNTNISRVVNSRKLSTALAVPEGRLTKYIVTDDVITNKMPQTRDLAAGQAYNKLKGKSPGKTTATR